MPTIPELVAHIRKWMPTATKHYGRFLDHAARLSDEQIADIVRFAKSRRGAEMALVHAINPRRR